MMQGKDTDFWETSKLNLCRYRKDFGIYVEMGSYWRDLSREVTCLKSFNRITLRSRKAGTDARGPIRSQLYNPDVSIRVPSEKQNH